MRLSDNVTVFQAGPFSLIGNLDTGYVIGLTEDGARVCERMSHQDVAESEVAEIDDMLLAHLKAGGFIEGISRTASEPARSAYLHVTPRCNLSCVGCYSRRQDDAASDLSLDELCSIVDRLASAGVKRLIISGGEPFLREDLPELIRHAKLDAHIEHVDILTNGTFVPTTALDKLIGIVDRICVSFDGPNQGSAAYLREQQRFDTLTDTVRTIQAAGIPTHIIATIHALNMDDIPAYKQLAAELDATVSFSLLSAPEDDSQTASLIPNDAALKNLAHALFGASMLSTDPAGGPLSTSLSVCSLCGAGNTNMSVDAKGALYPCHMLHYDELKMVSMLDESIDELCANNPFAHISVDSIPECASCDIRYLCGGGCRARAFYATGNAYARDPYCALMKEHHSILFKALSAMTQ